MFKGKGEEERTEGVRYSSKVEDGKGDFELLPQGSYSFVIHEIFDDKVGVDSEKPYCAFAFVVSGGDYDGRYVWDNISFGEKSGWKWTQLIRATGINLDEGYLISPESMRSALKEALLGKKVRAKVIHSKDRNGDKQAKIKRYFEKDGANEKSDVSQNSEKEEDSFS